MVSTSNFVYVTNLPVIIINKSELDSKYKYIDSGAEGLVYNYQNTYALKIFHKMLYEYGNQQIEKMSKVEEISKLKDEAFCFPIGLIGFEDYSKHGYYMQYIETNPKNPSFAELDGIVDTEKALELLIKADAAIKRIHEKGVIIGDLRGCNILIDNDNNPHFIDTDNYAYDNYDISLAHNCLRFLINTYNSCIDLTDNDKALFTLLALRILTGNSAFNCYQTKEGLSYQLERLHIDSEAKEVLNTIFSDSPNKPYLGPTLKRIKNEKVFK
jgi:serine/threonine protein kinase